MPISNELFLAILAMDSYNRGYNSGIKSSNAGSRQGLTGSSIGNATIGTSANADSDEAASFFAQSYMWNGQTVISYRGTDTDIAFGADVPAFAMGLGSYGTAQGNLAIDFYKTVNGNNAVTNTNITVTGHSLGGGLAGYVGSLYGLNGRLFDNMAFELAATNLLANDNVTPVQKDCAA